MSIIHDMPAEQYHATDAVSNGMLSAMAESPFHCWSKFHNPARPQRERTVSMFNGTLAHCALLESDAMASRYVVVPDDAPRRPTAAQWAAKKPSPESVSAMTWWSGFNASAAGRDIVLADQYDATKQMLAAVADQPEIVKYLRTGVAESSMFWTDSATGLPCRCRPDWLHTLQNGHVIAVDFKTASDVSPEGFGRSVATYGYHRQAAHYTNGIEAQGLTVDAFVFATVTSSYPFIAVAYVLDADAATQGFEEVAELLDLYGTCKASGLWPAYGAGLQPLSLPKWAQRSNEIEVSYAPL